MVRPLLLLLGCLSCVAAAALDTLAAPRAEQRVVDQAGILSPETEQEVTALGDGLGARGFLAVVTVASCDGGEPRTAATRLYNRWALPPRGALLFLAMGEHRVEIILGNDVDSDAEVATSQRIVDRDLLPRMRSGDHDGAVRAAAEAIARELLPDPASALAVERPATIIQLPAVERPAAIIQSPVVAPAAPRAYAPTPINPLWWWAGGALAALGGGLGLRHWWRYHKRSCPRCRSPLVLLDEQADDAHLAETEKTEERIGSVDYDLWACTGCNHVERQRWRSWFSSYSRCPSCQAVTQRSNTTTLSHATEWSTGVAQVTETCAHCGHQRVFTRTIPRRQRSRGSSLGSSGSSFSGGSHGGGGSGGGGTSSGRGGGGGW